MRAEKPEIITSKWHLSVETWCSVLPDETLKCSKLWRLGVVPGCFKHNLCISVNPFTHSAELRVFYPGYPSLLTDVSDSVAQLRQQVLRYFAVGCELYLHLLWTHSLLMFVLVSEEFSCVWSVRSSKWKTSRKTQKNKQDYVFCFFFFCNWFICQCLKENYWPDFY